MQGNEKTKHRTVELVKSDYQPTKSEREEEFKIDATFNQLAAAVVRPVKVRWIARPRPRTRR